MSTLEQMQRNVVRNLKYSSYLGLQLDVIKENPSSVYGVLTDPFLDDDMRDEGISQSAAIVDGLLILPIAASMHQFLEAGTTSLDYSSRVALEQTIRTGDMQIHPHQAFDPMPIALTPDPPVVRSNNDVPAQWASPLT